jgi:hypothetical protein
MRRPRPSPPSANPNAASVRAASGETARRPVPHAPLGHHRGMNSDAFQSKHGKKRCTRGKCQPLRDGTPCVAGTCRGGSCTAPPSPVACFQGLTACGGSCVDTRTAQANCGGCGIVCSPQQTCCGGDCVNLNTNRRNCGACGNLCPAGTDCCNGTCACVSPQICCRGSCQAGPPV